VCTLIIDWTGGQTWILHTKRGLAEFNSSGSSELSMLAAKVIEILYQTVVASAIYCAVVCWGSYISARDPNRLNTLIKNLSRRPAESRDRNWRCLSQSGTEDQRPRCSPS